MKQLFTLLFLILSTSILISCEEEDFSNVAEVDLSEYSDNLVVLAPIKPDFGDHEFQRFYLVLVKSNNILDESGAYQRIENATVDLFEEGEYQFTLEHWQNGIYTTSMPTGIETGKEYQLEIHSPEYGKITAKSSIPKRVKVLKAYLSDNDYYDALENVEKVEFTLEIEDEANVENYYYLSIRTLIRTDSSDYQSYPQFTFNDPVFDADDFGGDFLEIEELLNPQHDWSVTFRDELFEGQQKSLKVYVRKDALEGTVFDPNTGFFVEAEREVYFVVGAMSRELYLYKRSAVSQSKISENPFAEAVRVYDNIEGGVGIFGGFVEDTVFVE